MLMRDSRQRGVTLVELIVVMAIISMLTLMSAPAFQTWILNSRIRSTAESMLSGLQQAKSEAVARNARVRFQLTDTLDNACVLSPAGANWVINLDPNADPDEVVSLCGSAPNDAVAPFILQSRPAAAGSGNTQVAASAATLVFNGLGRLVPVPAGNITIDITNPAGGNCVAGGGDMTCLRIVVSAVGQVRMCNPAFPAGDPQGC
jgi:type IV fimbrial biogenesis protein FimT